MPEIPHKRQSIRPPWRVLLGGLLALLVLAVVWFAVSAAVRSGNEDCPAGTTKGAVSDRCS